MICTSDGYSWQKSGVDSNPTPFSSESTPEGTSTPHHLESFGIVQNRAESFEVVRGRSESFGVVRSRSESFGVGVVRNRSESSGVVCIH